MENINKTKVGLEYGFYNALWSGYYLKILGSDNETVLCNVETTIGMKGLNIPVTVKVVDNDVYKINHYLSEDFYDYVLFLIHSKIVNHSLKQAEKYGLDKDFDNTYLDSKERTHFMSTNAICLNKLILKKVFTVSEKLYQIEDYHKLTVGKNQLLQNRLDFIEEIEKCDNILDFIFRTFRLSM